MKNGGFRIKRVRLTQHGVSYDTFELTGYVSGERVRRRFKVRELAVGEKNRLEVQAANADGGLKTVSTRLTAAQLAEAEAAFVRIGARSLSATVE